MKKSILLSLTASLLLPLVSFASSPKPIINTDPSKVLGTGNNVNPNAQKISLKPGVYAIGDEHSKVYGNDYLIIDTYSNDEDKVLALYISQKTVSSPGSRSTNTGYGSIYIGQRIKGGTSMKLSPLYIDVTGDIASEAEISRSARIIEVSIRQDAENYRYPYLVQGHNGSLNGKLLGMRRITSKNKPELMPWPTSSVYRGMSESDHLLVAGNTVNVHNGRSMQRSYLLNPMNGDLGRFAQLIEGSFDTMTDDMTSETEVKKLAVFLRTTSGSELFIIASPTVELGTFKFEVYGPQCRSFMDAFFPGSL